MAAFPTISVSDPLTKEKIAENIKETTCNNLILHKKDFSKYQKVLQ